MNPLGVILLALGLGAAAVGAWLSWIELMAAGFGVMMLGLAAQVVRPPAAARWWDVEVPVRVVRGDAASVHLGVVVSGSSRWVRAVASESGRAWAVSESGELTWPIDTSRRGLHPVGPDRLEFADPFGLRRVVLAEREPTKVLVVPRVTPLETSNARSLLEPGLLGELAGAEQFVSLREYVVGDPLKFVHWKASARAGELMVRRMVDTTVPSLLVVLDVDVAAYPEPGYLFSEFSPLEFERAVDLAASWAWSACVPGQRVLLTTTAAEAVVVTMSAGSRDVGLDWLALVEASPTSGCVPGRVAAMGRAYSAGRVVLVTGSSGSADRVVATTSVGLVQVVRSS
jgi:uncharacterized protein (DUF58 family)